MRRIVRKITLLALPVFLVAYCLLGRLVRFSPPKVLYENRDLKTLRNLKDVEVDSGKSAQGSGITPSMSVSGTTSDHSNTLDEDRSLDPTNKAVTKDDTRVVLQGTSNTPTGTSDTPTGTSDTPIGRSDTPTGILDQTANKSSSPSIHTPLHKMNIPHVKTGTERIAEIDRKSKTQKKIISEYCARHHKKYKAPYSDYDKSHLFYNDEFKVIYCYLPKVACTNTKLMMEVLNGVFPPNTTQSRFKIHDGQTSVNFTLWSLPVAERLIRLKTYYKFVILRDPIVRLLSAYIDKLALPMTKDKISNSNTKIMVTKDMAIQLGIIKKPPTPLQARRPQPHHPLPQRRSPAQHPVVSRPLAPRPSLQRTPARHPWASRPIQQRPPVPRPPIPRPLPHHSPPKLPPVPRPPVPRPLAPHPPPHGSRTSKLTDEGQPQNGLLSNVPHRHLMSVVTQDEPSSPQHSQNNSQDQMWWLQKKPFESTQYRNETVYYVPFSVFLEYLMKRVHIPDEHFASASHLCTPCQLDFDYYVNYDTLAEDLHAVLDRVGAPRWLFPYKKEHDKISTEDLLDLYFGDMSAEDRLSMRRSLEEKTGYNFQGAPTRSISRSLLRGIFLHTGEDLDLYYSLFPNSTRTDKLYVS